MSADKKREKLPTFVTPKGVAVWPKLNTPDTKFDADGTYSVKLEIPTDEAKDFIAKLDELHEASIEKAKAENKGKKIKIADLPYGPKVYEENGETVTDESTTIVKCKLAAMVRPKKGEPWEQRPVLFDAKRQPMNAKVGGGSVIRVSGEVVPFYTAGVGAGISLRMRAVQVLDLKQFQSKDAAGYGFDEEDGFSSAADSADESEPNEAQEETTNTTSGSDEGSDF